MMDREEKPSAGHLGENGGVDDASGSSCLGRLKIFHPELKRHGICTEEVRGDAGGCERRRDRERRLPTDSVEM